ncbi:hypothetical protein, partial [Roseiflexus sp.]
RPFPAERRPKFISVTVLVARFWECSTPSNWFNLYGNCYKFSIFISPHHCSNAQSPFSLNIVEPIQRGVGGFCSS